MVFAMTKVLAVAAPKMVWYKLFNCNFHVGSFHHFLVEWAGKTWGLMCVSVPFCHFFLIWCFWLLWHLRPKCINNLPVPTVTEFVAANDATTCIDWSYLGYSMVDSNTMIRCTTLFFVYENTIPRSWSSRGPRSAWVFRRSTRSALVFRLLVDHYTTWLDLDKTWLTSSTWRDLQHTVAYSDLLHVRPRQF